MRRLRVVTTALVIFATLVVLSYPITVGASPGSNAVKLKKREYAIRLMTFATIASVSWFAAGLSAYFLSRRIRNEFEQEVVQNLTDLITSVPQKKKSDDVGTE